MKILFVFYYKIKTLQSTNGCYQKDASAMKCRERQGISPPNSVSTPLEANDVSRVMYISLESLFLCEWQHGHYLLFRVP